MRSIPVSTCHDCPLHTTDTDYGAVGDHSIEVCGHPDMGESERFLKIHSKSSVNLPIPDRCPLRRETISIGLFVP